MKTAKLLTAVALLLVASTAAMASGVSLTLTCPESTGAVGVPYSSYLLAGGGFSPYTFSIISGSLPPGLTVNPSTGAITGTPTIAGAFAFTAQVMDVLNETDLANCSITIVGAPFRVRYFANLNVGDSYINITNDGSSGGNICVGVYTFDPSEELVSCCACNLTPNALQSLSVKTDLLSNPLTPAATPTSVTVKLLATTNPAGSPPAGTLAACNAATAGALAPVEAWGSTIHATPQGTYRTTETEFSVAGVSIADLNQITALCGFAQSNGSGYGICKSCRAGGLGAAKQ